MIVRLLPAIGALCSALLAHLFGVSVVIAWVIAAPTILATTFTASVTAVKDYERRTR